MKKVLIIILTLIILSGCTSKNNNESKTNANNGNNLNINNENREVKSMKISINNKEYSVNLENNETVDALLNLLPLDITMNELNGNEKYYYLDTTLPVNSTIPGKVDAGDIMIYGNNCLVIFYKTFDTSYSYTKIGHIDNLPELNEKPNVIIKAE